MRKKLIIYIIITHTNDLSPPARLIFSPCRVRRSMKRPGVVMITWAPLVVNSLMSCTTVWAPPINWRCVIWGRFFRNCDNTSLIWEANSLVGEIIKAPISNFLSGCGLASRISRIGMMNARVFPEPVTASAQTSFFWSNKGIQAA